MAKKIGVILSGCGYLDGSEINEAVLTTLHLARAGAEIVFMAPDIEHSDVIDHFNGEPYLKEHVGVLQMAARIARGKIVNICEVKADDLDGLIVPGGFGAAKNLSNYAFVDNVHDMMVELHTHSLINDMFDAGKPLGFWCIAPAAVAAVALRDKKVNLSSGKDPKAALTCLRCGNEHIDGVEANDVIVDREAKVICCPAYMMSDDIVAVDEGIAKGVEAVLEFISNE